ncbi:hypothetical protein [uncultured Methanobrevibacter sp.]|nr:hypothetical protein [uncultured Methanobrevibacter sp.]
MERKYLKRYMDDDLERYLRMIGAVLMVRPNGVEKLQPPKDMLKVL